MIRNLQIRCLAAALVAGCAATASAAVWDESVNGDISGDRAAPSVATLAFGDNLVKGTTARGDLDYLAFEVPAGMTLAAIVLDNYESLDNKGFMAVQAGSVFTEPPGAAEVVVGNLLGYVLFGSGAAAEGNDLLPLMGTADGAIGFTAPLPAGPYTFWIQQTGLATTYEFNFKAAPEPSTVALAAVGAVGFLLMSRKRRRALSRDR